MIGHNWGAEHAERWTWIQANELRDGDGYFDAALGRIKVGPLTTPWVGNAMLRLDGEAHRLGGFDRIRSTRIDDQPTECEFELTGKGVRVRGRVCSEPRNFVAWVYADPVGPEHNTLNCSISDLELTVERDGREPLRLECVGAAAYEIGMRETDHGVPAAAVSGRLNGAQPTVEDARAASRRAASRARPGRPARRPSERLADRAVGRELALGQVGLQRVDERHVRDLPGLVAVADLRADLGRSRRPPPRGPQPSPGGARARGCATR